MPYRNLAPLLTAAVANARSAIVVDAILHSFKTVQITTVAFTGTLSIQGSFDGGVTWINLRYAVQGTEQDQGTTSIAFTASTATAVYFIVEPAPQLSVNLTGYSAGNVTVNYTGADVSMNLMAPAVMKTTAGGASAGQSLKRFNNTSPISINTGATTSIYTVTAGKTLFITDIYIGGDFTTGIEIQLKDGATIVLDIFVKGDTAPFDMTGLETQIQATGGNVLSIVWPTVTGKNGCYFISGYES